MATILKSADGTLRFRWSDEYLDGSRYTHHCPEVLNADGEVLHRLQPQASFQEAVTEIREWVSASEKTKGRAVKPKDVKVYWTFEDIDGINAQLLKVLNELYKLSDMYGDNSVRMAKVFEQVQGATDKVLAAQRELLVASEV